jgi:hypothetical protein
VKGVLDGVLGDVDVAEDADQDGDRAAVLRAGRCPRCRASVLERSDFDGQRHEDVGQPPGPRQRLVEVRHVDDAEAAECSFVSTYGRR